ncbi:hypothetical protein TWF506_002157 [Arthrobotrys conoides]|uniref:Uncharacterized protein n=1 Tax=Arthrobotrys conoides TaxID=74498 RepID=A0AAN8RUK5_9PEZI
MAQGLATKPTPGYDADSYSSEEDEEDENSRQSSIFQASLYFVEDGKQSGFISDPDQRLVSSHAHRQAQHETGTLSTSVDSCTTLVPNTLDIDYINRDPVYLDKDDPKAEPLRVYTSPMEPTERPPLMPAPPAQKRAEALAEILFRQDMQTYGLHVSTSAAAMSYIRRSEYHEALRATEFNFRAIQSQQRGYGDLRNHPFYRAAREDTPLLRSGALALSDNERLRRRQQQHRGQLVDQERTSGSGVIWGTTIWGGLLAILCCMAVPINDYTRESHGDWYY